MNQLVANVWKACKCSKIVMLTLNLVFVGTVRSDYILPFGQADLLEALFQEQKQHGPILLLVHGQAQNDPHFEVRMHL